MLMQAVAMLTDAYRELNAKRLFWIVLALSGLVVLAFAIVGVTPTGISILWWDIPMPMVNSVLYPKQFFYKFMFFNLGIGLWLTWIAMVLALISVSGMIPDLVAGGSIELTLSRPISRVRLFLLKYASGLLFVALQVLVFASASFVVIGVRSGAWEPRLLLAVPLVIIVFSFIYCICALVGLVTRSAMTAMLATLLIWFGIFAVNLSEKLFLSLSTMNAMTVEARQGEFERYVKTVQTTLGDEPTGNIADLSDRSRLNVLQRGNVDNYESKLERDRSNGRILRRVHLALFGTMTVLPKTAETTQLLERALFSQEDLKRMRSSTPPPKMPTLEEGEVRIDQTEVAERVENRLRERSIWWVMGTSLAFEAVLLGICCWIFARRDF